MGGHTTGWVYVIVNDSIPNKVKVGVTKNHPRLRAKEMNQISAPLPTPYYAATAFLFEDRAYRIEQDTHRLLKKKGVHIEGGAGQEWFECSAIDAAYAIREASTLLNEPIQTENPVLLTPEEIAARKRFSEFEKAAEQGDAKAQTMLGSSYMTGDGVEVNYKEAMKWCRKAVEQGFAAAQHLYGFFLTVSETSPGKYKSDRKPYEEAVKWYRKAAEQGYAKAQFDLGACFAWGRGVEKNDGEAVKWYRKAAKQGYAKAQFNLGSRYSKGQGVEKNDGEAVKWYRKAAEQGYASAQFNLGSCYSNGQGVEKNGGEAVKWYRKAAEQGYGKAQAWLRQLEIEKIKKEIENDQRNREREKVSKYNDATEKRNALVEKAKAGDFHAQLVISYYYSSNNKLGNEYGDWGDGLGGNLDFIKTIEEDPCVVFQHFRNEVKKGHSYYSNMLGFCYALGYGVMANPEEAFYWFKKAASWYTGGASIQTANAMAFCYLNGFGVRKNARKATKWQEKAQSLQQSLYDEQRAEKRGM